MNFGVPVFMQQGHTRKNSKYRGLRKVIIVTVWPGSEEARLNEHGGWVGKTKAEFTPRLHSKSQKGDSSAQYTQTNANAI